MHAAPVVRFAEPHLDAVLALCAAEGWPSLPADPARAMRVLTGPAAISLCALEDDGVIGFALAMSDGAIDVYLSLLVVSETHRRQGIARRLIDELFGVTGVERIDLLAEPGSEAFYESLPHHRFTGYRLYRPG